MYWLAPLLPADVTTTTPAFAAFVVATADGSSFVPNERAERHVDHVHVVVDRPFDRVDRDVGRAVAAEHADRVDVGLRRDAGADRSRCCPRRSSRCTDRHTSCRSRARPSPPPCRRRASRARRSRCMNAVERIRIRVRNRLVRGGVRIGVVAVADEVDAALDARGRGAEPRGIRRRGIRQRALRCRPPRCPGRRNSRACSRCRCRSRRS